LRRAVTSRSNDLIFYHMKPDKLGPVHIIEVALNGISDHGVLSVPPVEWGWPHCSTIEQQVRAAGVPAYRLLRCSHYKHVQRSNTGAARTLGVRGAWRQEARAT
jgi:hypothetical protein